MTVYKNLGGDSGVVTYVKEPDSMTVTFRDGWSYLYTTHSASPEKINKMQSLAAGGIGLHGYINTSLKYQYEAKTPPTN